ncbi:NAD-dependent epimerase/dehydratase family protein [Luteimonas mephitis]|uniref:NAD-dependent epimerase/dehydratase family protein n=1 Tax=Luteimonas mephitis TaxID=83615 RepID=UPI003A9220F7
MKVLLTGAGGFLGRRIAASLLRAGVSELRLHFRSRPPAGMMEALARSHPDANIEVVGANLLHPQALDALCARIDVLVHAAAGMRGSAADMFANTVVGTRNLLDAAAIADVRRVVLVSSFSVYRTAQLHGGAVHDESLEIEPVGVEKGAYAHAKTRQEHLLDEYRERFGFETVVLRPGVIYGPGGGAFSSRVGIRAMGLFFNLGRGAQLPLTYVENCADAVAMAALHGNAGAAYNVVDDDLPSCSEYLRGFQRRVGRMRVVPVPYWMFALGARFLVRYHRVSKGQLPAVFTPYIVRSMYRPLRYSNAALKALGWRPRVATRDGLQATFDHFAEHPP